MWSLREPVLESECVYGMDRHSGWVHSLKIPARSRQRCQPHLLFSIQRQAVPGETQGPQLVLVSHVEA